MTKISIVTPTFNEDQNIQKLCLDIKKEMEKLSLDYEHIIIDNSSTDNTIKILKRHIVVDKRECRGHLFFLTHYHELLLADTEN